MTAPHNVAKTALIANGAVWFGTALFLAGSAGEQTWDAFHGQWYNILGWAIIITAAIGTATLGTVEGRRLRERLRTHAGQQ